MFCRILLLVVVPLLYACTSKDSEESKQTIDKVNTPSFIRIKAETDSIELSVDSIFSTIVQQSAYEFEYPNKLAVHRKLYVRRGNIPLIELLRKVEKITYTTASMDGARIKLIFAYKNSLCGNVVDEQNNPVKGVAVTNDECGCWVETDYDGYFCIVIFDRTQDSLSLSHKGYASVRVRVSDKKPFVVIMRKI